MPKKLVIVESPTKARTIRKFLSKDYVVESCMGHVRDLPKSAREVPEKFKKEKWAHLGVNVEKEFEPIYCIPKSKAKVVTELKKKLKDVDELILATDEDREGESISWHLLEVLKPQVPSKRMVFHEITATAIKKALKDFRNVDYNLVRAQEARRILDRLVGYTISPLLWKKVAYGLSAGRVQSVAVCLISEREHERIRFKKASYWGIQGILEKNRLKFETRILSHKGKKVATGKDFDSQTGKLLESRKNQITHLNETLAKKLATDLKSKAWMVSQVEEKPVSRNPAAPFITSTIQQEANRKLGLSSGETMSVAQKLYERGFITYMRTDSTNLSDQAIQAARSCIQSLYGSSYLPPQPRHYTAKKVKGAQEAHEAIRPAGDEFKKPDQSGLTGSFLQLYDLIWKRTVASQMKNSEHKQMSIQFEVGDAIFSASGMTIEFPGFLKAYVEGKDDPDAALDNREIRLPKMSKGDQVKCCELKATSHETKPPPRYTEASLVRTMEKEGIGRPSTYATVISTIQSRGYIRKMGNALTPTFTALVVSKLLKSYLPNYVDTGFTSDMEKSLDDISQGDQQWDSYLGSIYFGDKGLRDQVEKQLELIDNETCRSIELEGLKGLNFKVGRYGAYVCRYDGEAEVCASLPESCLPGDISSVEANKLIDQKLKGADALVQHPETGLPVYVLTGRYGPYVQMGESEVEKGAAKPKRVSIPPTIDHESITVEQALKLLELPKTLGSHPETDKAVKVGLGRFGPYVVHDGDFRSIPSATDNLFEMTFERAIELLSQPKKSRGRTTPLKELGNHPKTNEPMALFTGKYGPYIKCGKVNVSLPEGIPPEDTTAEQAIDLLTTKMSGTKTKSRPKKVGKKTAQKKQEKDRQKVIRRRPGKASKVRSKEAG